MSTSGSERSVLLTVSRSRRRALVVAVYLLMFGFSAGLAFGSESWRILIVVLVAEAIYLILVHRYISPINKEITGKKARYLDERQLLVRDRAHYHAYQILGTFLISIIFLPVVAAQYGGASFPMSFTHWQLQGLLLLCINLVISLPASVLAWTEPDPKPDE